MKRATAPATSAAAATAVSDKIVVLRQAIDAIDRDIARLLLQRAKLSFAVRTMKKRIGRPVRDSAREKEIIARYVRVASKKGAAPAAMEVCAASILAYSRTFDPHR